MLTLIHGGELYGPGRLGRVDVLAVGASIARLGEIDQKALAATGLNIEVIDAHDCVVVPGFVDCHEHLTGGSGERGFASQTPEVTFSELVSGGITTVVGCLGVDTTTRTMEALVAKAKGLNEEGVSAYAYTGGYDVPPVTSTGSVRTDLLFVQEIIAVGEVAISDRRSTEPSIPELARLVRSAYVGGMLSGKSGVTHFHVGDEATRLAPLRRLIDDYNIDPTLLYPTHVERNEALMAEAVDLTRLGVTVDVDVVERDLPKWFRFFTDRGGDLTRLTASSDAAINSPGTLLGQIRACVIEHGVPLEHVLPLVTSTPAGVLKLSRKGRIRGGVDADILVMERRSLDLRALLARGKVLVNDGRLLKRESFLASTNRRIRLDGDQATPTTLPS